MIFRISTLLLLSSVASAIEVSMIDMEDILENHRVVVDSTDPSTSSRRPGNKGARGYSLVTSKLKTLLMKTANSGIGASVSDPSEWHEASTTFLTSTTNYHRDRNRGERMGPFEVGFVALNTNDDAYFDYPGVSIPIQEGAFIRFDGTDPHRTVVNKGIVHLLGPFDVTTFDRVEEAPAQCCNGAACVSPTDFSGSTSQEDCENSGFDYGGGSGCPLGCPINSKSVKSSKSPTTKVPKIGKKTKAPKLSEETKSP